MNRKLVITKIERKIITSIIENDDIVELHCTSEKQEEDIPHLGDIYVGKVKNIVANIDAAFIEIANGLECYYALKDNPTPVFTKKTGKKPLCIGDELLVQISKEPVKTKAPTVSSKLDFSGKYAVLTFGDCRIGASSKLTKNEKTRLMEIAAEYVSEEYGFIIRTNAKEASEEVLRNELQSLIKEYEELRRIADTRVCFSCLKQAPREYLTDLKNINQDGFSEILVEDKKLFEEIKNYLEKEQPEDLGKLRLYEDRLLPLHKVYAIERNLELALKEYVWLKSGAYLVIQPTEALTVIDVNTGKNISKKKDDDTYFKINMEAAKEAARQIRLRNLSGIIIIDFINMDKKEYTEKLLSEFSFMLKRDPIVTSLIDMTKLQLVEVTRKKVRKPLHETLRNV